MLDVHLSPLFLSSSSGLKEASLCDELTLLRSCCCYPADTPPTSEERGLLMSRQRLFGESKSSSGEPAANCRSSSDTLRDLITRAVYYRH